ncbi:hypothetical protein H181DRAFT_03209 [Streptomyces sp. WMMB 714]|uniref:hypothetical protein n=1 Tax=Streptomyces sp. WMMB 714 TaxID=1286822 RepID=UPI0005F80119|nr:hypothetical protein [Streptomyces sp. WMMB 714]SCK38071.1 hypothetical protein H181DRAFT_03209 [Streptomyces sp. WMMB 714]
MLDTAPLTTAAQLHSDRLRRLPESALRRGAAAEGLALARELARRAQLLEFPGSTPLDLPDVGVLAVGDQLAVAAHDLAEIVRGLDAADELAEATALVEEAGRRIGAATARR